MDWYYEVTTSRDFDSTVQAIQDAVAKEGFRVQYVHDVQATFKERGVERGPYKIIETCNVRYASQALRADPLIGLMMPCRIVVFTQNGATHVALSLPGMLASFFPEAKLEAMAAEVEAIMRRVVDSVK